jgi:hypothetical protein
VQACVQSPCAHHLSPRVEKIDNLTPSRCQRLLKGIGARRRLFARPAWPAGSFYCRTARKRARSLAGFVYEHAAITSPVPLIGRHEDEQAFVQSPCTHHVSPRAEQIVNLALSNCQRLSQGVGARRRIFARPAPAWPAGDFFCRTARKCARSLAGCRRRTCRYHCTRAINRTIRRRECVRAVALCASRESAKSSHLVLSP